MGTKLFLSFLNGIHGTLSFIFSEDTKVLAAQYGPKARTKKNENAEKACLKSYGSLKPDRLVIVNAFSFSERGLFCRLKYETILKRTLQSICVLRVVPNTTTSVIIQVVHDGGSVSFLCSFHLGKHLLMLSETHITRYKQCLFEYL
ncbi:putative ribosomal protein S5 domain 2-type [Arabidopsis thaliana]